MVVDFSTKHWPVTMKWIEDKIREDRDQLGGILHIIEVRENNGSNDRDLIKRYSALSFQEFERMGELSDQALWSEVVIRAWSFAKKVDVRGTIYECKKDPATALLQAWSDNNLQCLVVGENEGGNGEGYVNNSTVRTALSSKLRMVESREMEPGKGREMDLTVKGWVHVFKAARPPQ